MSEYLSKKAVLESISEAYQTSLEDSDQADWEEGYRSALRFVKRTIQSGAFDAEPNGEVQRLRAALVAIKPYIDEDFPNGPDGESDATVGYRLAYKKIVEALFTTTEPCVCESIKCECGHHEPTGAERVRELWNITKQRVDEPEDYLQQEYFAGKAIGIMDTLNALGVTIPGINAPEGDRNDA